MNRDYIRNAYFYWLCEIVAKNKYSNGISYRKLLMLLHNTEFTYMLQRDQNRASDGIDLRYRFTLANEFERDSKLISDYLDGPCSVLEMMVALSIRMEENIMDNPALGDRTGQWFWQMIVSLGLGDMMDSRFNKNVCNEILDIFLNRDYERDGHGGLFTIKKCEDDLRDVEIWYQMCWYLDSIA